MFEIYYVAQIAQSEWQERNRKLNAGCAEGVAVRVPNAIDRAASILRQALARLATRAEARPFPATQPHAMEW